VDDPNIYIELRENSQDSPSEVLFIIYYLLFIKLIPKLKTKQIN